MRREEPRSRLWLTAVLLGAASYWALDLLVLRAAVPRLVDDLWDYGVVARELLLGHGFRTLVIYPPLWGLRDAALTVPMLVHTPVLPVLLAPLLALWGPASLEHVAVIAAAFAWLAALILFRLGRRLAGAPVGAAAALTFTLAPLTLDGVNHDTSMILGAFLLVLAFDLLAREEPRLLTAAVVVGLGQLVRPEMPLALAGLSMLAGGAGTVILLLALVLFGGAWWWHNLRAAGSPFFNLSSYMVAGQPGRWPGMAVLRDFTLTPERWPRRLVELLPSLPQKIAAYAPRALGRAALAPGALTGWLVAVGFVVGVSRTSTRWIAIAALVCGLVPLAIMTLTIYDPRYLTPFLPLWALAAAVGAEWLWRRLPGAERSPVWVAALLLLMLPSTVPALVGQTGEARELEARLASERARLARATRRIALPRLTPLGLEKPADAPPPAAPRLMYSDTPDFVAWTTGRPTLWITRPDYERLSPPPPPARGDAAVRSAEASAPADTLPTRGAPEDTWFHPPGPERGVRLPGFAPSRGE